MIEEYRFGSITINGKTYNYDVEVRWNGAAKGEPSLKGLEVLKWWRRESHLIDIEDVKRAVEQNPNTIVIGTGESGVAEVTGTAQEFITNQGIKLIIDLTGEAVKTFNVIGGKLTAKRNEQNKVIGLFHLTC